MTTKTKRMNDMMIWWRGQRKKRGLDWTGWKAGAGVYKQAKGREGSVSQPVRQSVSQSVGQSCDDDASDGNKC
jgi:hypothetical protein